MTLISVLVALLIFAFSLLALAGLYTRLVSAQLGNELTTSTQTIGNRFWALLQAHPGLVQALKAQGSSVTYTQASMGGAPAGLQPLLARTGWRLLPSDTAIQALVVGSNGAALAWRAQQCRDTRLRATPGPPPDFVHRRA